MSGRPCREWIASVAAALLLAACGGGGDDTPPPVNYAVKMAMDQLLTTAHSWTLTGTDPNAQAFTLTLAFAPLSDGPFPVNGTVARRAQETLTVASAGQSSSGVQTIYLDRSSLSFVGFEADGSCSVATSNVVLPASTALGSSGAHFGLSDLDGCASNAAAAGTTAGTWSLEIDSGVALLCWNLTSKDLAGVQNGSVSTCFEIAIDGSLGSRARFTLIALGVNLKARNF
jgi:hypothetical protein